MHFSIPDGKELHNFIFKEIKMTFKRKGKRKNIFDFCLMFTIQQKYTHRMKRKKNKKSMVINLMNEQGR